MKKYLIKILSLTLIIVTLLSIATPTAHAGYLSKKAPKTTYITNNLIISKWHICLLTKQKAPTCTEDGYTKYKCIFCRYTTTFTYDAQGHSEIIDPFVAPTCTDYGLNEGSHCSKCNTILIKQTKIEPLGHSFSETIQKATPEADGNIKSICSVCGYEENKPISKPDMIDINPTAFEYTGKEITPTVTVYDRNGFIIEPNNYTIEYNNNIYVGTATAKITFIGDYYEGSVEKNFTIKSGFDWYIRVKNYRPKGFSVTFPVDTFVKKVEIQYSLSATFQKADISTKTVAIPISVKEAKNLTYTVTDLQPSKTYYVRARVQYSSGIYSNWSQKSIKTNNY